MRTKEQVADYLLVRPEAIWCLPLRELALLETSVLDKFLKELGFSPDELEEMGENIETIYGVNRARSESHA